MVDLPLGLEQLHGIILHLTGLERGPGELGVAASPRRLAEYYRPVRLLDGVYAQSDSCGRRLDRRLISVQEGSQKLIAGSDGVRRLYDLALDPGEGVDLSESEPDRVAELSRSLVRRQQLAEQHAPDSEVPELDEATKQSLRALGYLHDAQDEIAPSASGGDERPEHERPPRD